MTRRRSLTLLSLALASAFSIALAGVRVAYSGNLTYAFLVWNLFLAWIPFVLAIFVYDGYRRGASPWRLLMLSALWLLFFPNAPYILTDFIHLHPHPRVPLWFDLIEISAFAWTGLLLGFASLYLMQAVARRIVGPRKAWLLAVSALALGSFGIYLGRFKHLNSWDALLQPRHLLIDPLSHPGPLAVVLGLAGLLSCMYLVLYSLLRLQAESDS